MDLFGDNNPESSIHIDIRSRPEESLNHLSINKEFAERYLHNQQRAELHQLESKYGQDAGDIEDDDDDSEDDVTEDEDGDQINANVDAAIFRTLQRIRNKDAALYDPDIDIFEQESKAAQEAARSSGSAPTVAASKKGKRVTLQDYQRQRVQELIESSADPAQELADITTVTSDRNRYSDEQLPPALEQEQLRKEVSHAFHAGLDDSEDLFTKRKYDTAEGDSTSYRSAVLASLGPNADENTIRQALRTHSDSQPVISAHDTSAEQQANEDFLLNFILNRGWIDQQDGATPAKPKLPRSAPESGSNVQGEASSSIGAYGRDWEAEAADLESEASFDSMADAFETAYNFRFEQGDEANIIPTYSRNPKDTARRQDNSRKRKREERLDRKEQEKQQKMQEMSRLKNLKRSEIVEKLKRLREVTGSRMEDLEHIDLENDFDPQEHDRAMAKMFGDTYYTEEGDLDDSEKPSWDDDIEIDDIIADAEEMNPKAQSKAKAKATNHLDEDRIEMDADFLDDAPSAKPTGKEASIRALLADKKLSKKERKKLKKKLKAATEKSGKNEEGQESIDENDMDAATSEQVELSTTDRKQKAKEIIDEYYNLDYEDMIGDQPTRFKYAQVAPADYGMSAVDILLADDMQLNNVVGLKNLQPYRKGKARPIDLGKRLGDFRREVYGQQKNAASRQGADGESGTTKKRLGKKERQRLKKAETPTAESSSAA